MKCVNPFVKIISEGDPYASPPVPPRYVAFPCGKCLACRVNKRREWTLRLVYELNHSKSANFVTLTYDDAHLPRDENDNPCPSVEDLQKFIKRLRWKFPKCNIRYMINSEYGPSTYRPHYHGIIFNLPDEIYNGSSKIVRGDYPSWHVPILEDVWQLGDVESAPAVRETCSYVCKYFVDRQPSLDLLKPNISVQSRKPGIGSAAIEGISHKVRYYDLKSLDLQGVRHVAIPRFFKNKIYSEDERHEHFLRFIEDFSFDEQSLVAMNESAQVESIRRQIMKFNNPKSKIK